MVAAATALVLLGGSIVPFLSPIYVRFEQDRTGASALTGYSEAQLDRVTGALLADLVLWSGNFEITLNGLPVDNDGDAVLSPPEVAHMRDVRGVFAGFFAVVLAAAVVVIAAFRRARGTEARADAWRALASGAKGLTIAIAVVGAFTLLAFEAAFEVFHRLFFSAGSYTFDPRTDRLVQLFPEAFWSETAIFVGGVVLLASILTWWFARRRAGGVSARDDA